MIKNFTDLTGKKAIVTGGAQGLSRGMVEGLMQAGAEVCIIDINPRTEQIVQELKNQDFPVGEFAQILEMRRV